LFCKSFNNKRQNDVVITDKYQVTPTHNVSSHENGSRSMFEAHIYSQSSRPETVPGSRLVKLNAPACCWHSTYQCNVRYWITAGKRQSLEQLFLYIEFRNRDNSHSYKVIELCGTNLSTEQIQDIICRTPLSLQLDPIKTEQWCQSL